MAEHDDIKTEYNPPDNNDGQNARTLIADYIVHTPKDKISELTSLPLDQHRPHAMISMLSDVLRHNCNKVIARQERLNKIWAKYHKNEKGEGIEPVDLKNDKAWQVDKMYETFLEKWSFRFKQLRRGYKNELLMSATTLGQSELESEPTQSPESVLEHFIPDKERYEK